MGLPATRTRAGAPALGWPLLRSSPWSARWEPEAVDRSVGQFSAQPPDPPADTCSSLSSTWQSASRFAVDAGKFTFASASAASSSAARSERARRRPLHATHLCYAVHHAQALRLSKVNAVARGNTRDLRVLWALEEIELRASGAMNMRLSSPSVELSLRTAQLPRILPDASSSTQSSPP
jgi:hypothetical protein